MTMLLASMLFVGTAAAASTIPLTRRTVDLIKHLEGFVAQPAPDPVGLPTVGYGHQCTMANCSEIPRLPLTPTSAHSLLLKDIAEHAVALSQSIATPVVLNPNQWGALISWAYNVGSQSVKQSELVKKLNAGELPENVVRQELPKWVTVDGKTLPGLVVRRKKEIDLFFS
ncbi:hypothetical protein FB645_001848 [Coemansia sp. IMI 203386]|nr:hypothetical protein FB645_001848 [Coemansia sp. IMI 203386]